MVSFKESLEADLDTFFNENEFAEIHDIDGLEVPAVIDSEILKKRDNKAKQYEGVYMDQVVLYVKAKDLPDQPVFGQHIRLDGKLYIVVACTEDNGVFEITLGANES